MPPQEQIKPASKPISRPAGILAAGRSPIVIGTAWRNAMMQIQELHRHRDGSFDLDFYRVGAAALRRQAMRDRSTLKVALGSLLLMLAALSIATALVSATTPVAGDHVVVASSGTPHIR
jgi:hypothetical protein